MLAVPSGRGQQIELIDTATGREIATLTPPNPLNIAGLCFSPDGSHLAVSCYNFHLIQLWGLRALRAGLAELNLAGNWPAYPAPSRPESTTPEIVCVAPV